MIDFFNEKELTAAGCSSLKIQGGYSSNETSQNINNKPF
jgi:hypothetical protein